MENNKIREYIQKVLSESFDEKDQELLNTADKATENEDAKEDEVEDGMSRSISMGRGVNAKPKNYPKNFTRQAK